MTQVWIGLGAVFAFLSVSLGAFAAHGLEKSLEPRMLEIFRTGAQYQMYHALALVAFGLWTQQNPQAANSVPGWAFTLGILIFSGSLYALSTSGIRWLGAITPIGGVAFLIGWASFAWLAFRAR